MKPTFFLFHGSNIDFGFSYTVESSAKQQMHTHDYYEIFLTLSELTHCINGTQQRLKENTLVFIRPHDVHMYLPPEGKKDFYFINLAFRKEVMQQLLVYFDNTFKMEPLLSSQYPVGVILDKRDTDWIQLQLKKTYSIDRNDTQALRLQFRVLLFSIFTRYFSTTTKEKNEAIPLWLSSACEEMQKVKNFSVGMPRMLELCGKSREYVGRNMKKYYKASITEYINDLRLNYMSNMLISTNLKILDICYECGFQNISWAYELFTRKFGIPPHVFRKIQEPYHSERKE